MLLACFTDTQCLIHTHRLEEKLEIEILAPSGKKQKLIYDSLFPEDAALIVAGLILRGSGSIALVDYISMLEEAVEEGILSKSDINSPISFFHRYLVIVEEESSKSERSASGATGA